jgi:hypothetical protein
VCVGSVFFLVSNVHATAARGAARHGPTCHLPESIPFLGRRDYLGGPDPFEEEESLR